MEVVITIVGAAVGAAFQQLFDSVIKAHRKATKFKSLFNDLKLTLESYQALVQYIEQDDINVPPMQGLDDFKVKMEEGRQLVEKCSNIHPLQLKISFIKTRKVARLRALDTSLQTLYRTLKLHVDNNILDRVDKLKTSVNRMHQTVLMTQRQTGSSCAVPDPPSFTVGLKKPLEDLKMKFLYNDQVSMFVLTAPGGYGKTTLAQKFCQDQQVQEKFKKNICFVTVSEKPNVNSIVEELCRSTGSLVPAFQNEANALSRLQQVLVEAGQNPLLLVLDDVWLGASELLEKCRVSGWLVVQN